MRTRVSIMAAALALAAVACGGGSSESTDESVARRWAEAALEGRAGAAWELLHPGVQAGTSREAYIACAAGGGAPSAAVKVLESTPGPYVARDGSPRDGVQVVVRATVGGASDTVALWVVDGRVAGAGVDDGGCAPRL